MSLKLANPKLNETSNPKLAARILDIMYVGPGTLREIVLDNRGTPPSMSQKIMNELEHLGLIKRGPLIKEDDGLNPIYYRADMTKFPMLAG